VIIVDTHAWIWWAGGSKKLPAPMRRRIDRAKSIGICLMSCWEVAMLVSRGRLKLDREPRVWVRQALSLARVELVPMEPETAVVAAQLPDFGGDPVDCMIVATAREKRAPLVTADERIHESGLVEALW
jgi:PIN domain nuclease of toxin-antitoxin system